LAVDPRQKQPSRCKDAVPRPIKTAATAAQRDASGAKLRVTVEPVATPVVCRASPAASLVTGSALLADRGWTHGEDHLR
jgi:hypothetical protein